MCSTTMPQELADGYSRFASDRAEEQQKLYEQLGKGQSPHTLVISCADSRVDPATIFGAGPGELFVIRNVANIVPPHAAYAEDPNANLAGTAAALEWRRKSCIPRRNHIPNRLRTHSKHELRHLLLALVFGRRWLFARQRVAMFVTR